MSFDPHAPDVAAALEALEHVGAGIIAEIAADDLRALVDRVQMRQCQYMHGGTETMFCTLACKHYTVTDEDGYARTYDEDEGVLIRVGDIRAVLDVATMSMNFASGFLEEEQVEALRKLAGQLGIDPLLATPHNFVCKYSGTHQWRPMTLYVNVPTLQATDSSELLDRLRNAKAGGDSAELNAAKEAMRADRTARRTENDPWTQPAHTPRRPMDICPLCNHTRPTPAVWSAGSGRYTLELTIVPERRAEYTTDIVPVLDGILTLYQESEIGELVIDQRRVNADHPDNPDDRLVWIGWGTDRLALSRPEQPLVTWLSPPGVSPPVVSQDQHPKAPEEEL